MINHSMCNREHLANHLSIIVMHRNGAHWHCYATFIDTRLLRLSTFYSRPAMRRGRIIK